MKVRWTNPAKIKLKKIHAHYKTVATPAIAKRIKSALFRRTDILKIYPHIGQKELYIPVVKRKFRYLLEGKYKIIYIVQAEKKIIYILAIIETYRDPARLLLIE